MLKAEDWPLYFIIQCLENSGKTNGKIAKMHIDLEIKRHVGLQSFTCILYNVKPEP